MKRLVFGALLALAACGKSSDPTATASTEAIPARPHAEFAAAGAAHDGPREEDRTGLQTTPSVDASASLAERLACLNASGGVVIVGHRGGPTRDFPANALETLQRTYRAGTHGMEIDVAQTSDGHLYLMHDETLDRATTGHGAPDALKWADVQNLNLRTGRTVTDYHPASLDAVLDWAVASHALIELDRKDTTSFPALAEAIRKAHAENNVLAVTYTDAQTLEVHAKAPDLTIVAAIHDAGQLDRLLKRGVAADHLVAWTGTETPDPDLWKELKAKGVVAAFGTLGPRGKSLDTAYWADGDGSEYRGLVFDGLRLLVTDLTDKVSRELAGPMEKGRRCGF
jgi:glycerophosphoryl diester phosphodiesterase